MITYRGFSAWVVSEGCPLPEYLVSINSNANMVSCWVPSEPGKSFSVHWRDEGSQQCSCAFIGLDGFLVPGRFLEGYGEASREGVRTGPGSERPFVFAEQTNPASRVQASQEMGTITLKIKLVSMNGQRLANPVQQLPEPSGSSINQHYVSYGPERNTYLQNPLTWSVQPADGKDYRSFVTFIFRYRSREFLLSQGIMPTEDEPRIPPAVQRSCAATRRVFSAPVASSSTSAISIATPCSQVADDVEGSAPAPREAANPTSGPVRNARSVSVRIPSRPVRYPGEMILDLPYFGSQNATERGGRQNQKYAGMSIMGA